MRKKILMITIFLAVFLMISSATAVNITNSSIIKKQSNLNYLTDAASTEYNIIAHTDKLEQILGINQNKINELENQNNEEKEFTISLLNSITDTNINQDLEDMLTEIENNFNENDVEYFYNTIDIVYDEEYIQQLLNSIEQAFNENNFDEIIAMCNLFKNTDEFNDFYQHLTDSNNQEYLKTFETIKNQDKLNSLINNVKNNLSSQETTGLLEFWLVWITTWAILIDEYFSIFHPIVHNMMGTIPLVILFFPMTYILFIVAFIKTLINYFTSSKSSTKQVSFIQDLFSILHFERFNIFEKIMKKILLRKISV